MRNRRVTVQGDRGAVLVIVAVFAIVAVVMLAAVIDLGNQRGTKKQTTLSTDSAALAAASVIDFADPEAVIGTSPSCAAIDSTDSDFATVQDVVNDYLSENGAATSAACQIHIDNFSAAYVTVAADENVAYQIAAGLGQLKGTVSGSSSARTDLRVGGGLYPVGLCTAGAEDVLDGVPNKVFDPPEPSTILFDAACGGSGNKRQVQFIINQTGDSCGKKGMWCWDFNAGGFKGSPQIVESDTGKDWQKAEDSILDLANAGTHIWIPAIKERPDLPSNGTFAKYEVTHFVEVVLTGYSKKDGLKFDVYQIIPWRSEGPTTASNDEAVQPHICAVGLGEDGCGPKPLPATDGDPDIDLSNPTDCLLSFISSPPIIKTKKASGNVSVEGDHIWTFDLSGDCETISAAARFKATTVSLDGGGTPQATMSLTLLDGTSLVPSDEGKAVTVTFESGDDELAAQQYG